MAFVCASIGSVIVGVVCLLLSIGMIVQILFVQDPFYFYDEFYFKEMLLVPRDMMLWCLAEGAFGITCSLISIIFAFACTSCGLPTAIAFNIICALSSLAMAGISAYETLSFRVNQDDQWTIPLTNIGAPFLFAFLFLILTICSCCTRNSHQKNKKFFDL